MVVASPPRARRVLSIVAVLLAASFAAVLFAAPRASALRVVSGPIVADEVWGPVDSPFLVVGDVTVRPGVTLTILPGTTVRFDPSRALYVEGLLTADGAPGSEIQFLPNLTISPIPWRGIQFNATSGGSITWSIFDRPEVAVRAETSSPTIAFNLVRTATFGFLLSDSSSWVTDNTILRASFVGIYSVGGSPVISRNAVNGTLIGIEADAPFAGSAFPFISENTITNVSGFFSVGVYTTTGVTPWIFDNQIIGVVGARGANGLAPGEPGGAGAVAVGILVVGAPWAGIWGNVIDAAFGGRGGNGRENVSGTGGSGGPGGPGAGIVVSGTPEVEMSGNTITNVQGGRGGDGGGSALTARGGNGGAGGSALGVQVFDATSFARWYFNDIDGPRGGPGGNGGSGTLSVGMGGGGGDAYGIFSIDTANGDASWNSIQNVLGGVGGNSTAAGGSRTAGGLGGDASGIAYHFLGGASIASGNSIMTMTGGQGGRGANAAAGGNATGVFVLGTGVGGFNLTSAAFNWVAFLVGGEGGIGDRVGGPGGSASGFAAVNVDLSTASNSFWFLQGGDGGDALDGSDAGRGGDAAGMAAVQVPTGLSSRDGVLSVSAGAAGLGGVVPSSYAAGYFALGSSGIRTAWTLDNATVSGTGTFDIAVDNYASVTTVNVVFDGARVSIGPAGNLTVRNYLDVNVYWPDGASLVSGSRIRVRDNGATVFDLVSATGQPRWLLLTDRIYVNSNTATENTTEIQVSYLTYSFLNNPRSEPVFSMASSIVETFVMDDQAAPASAADPLPTYTTVSTFNVSYTASDGNGTGLRDITLWYRLNGSGGWVAYATQPAAASGQVSFTASVDGTYEFATTATDNAGNKEAGPAGNDTWTIVDTVRPGSRVNPLPTYENTSSFLVSWAPDVGVTDIASYTIQYRHQGGPWTDWLVGTTLTSETFTADPSWGLYEFRSIATDRAGNVESAPAGNDTWTIVDVLAPLSRVVSLPMYQTSLDFTVSWGPQFDTTDIATYRIEVRDNGGAWTAWIASTTATSSLFSGADGHTYEFRSISTDRAGNVESIPPGNDTWTIVDVTPPGSAVAPLSLYITIATFAVSWGPSGGTTDIATYTLEVSDDGGAWTPVAGYIDTVVTSGTFTGIDGHTYAFRSIATDRAGNVEPAPAGNDTWTVADLSAPLSSHTLAGPSGANGWYLGSVTVTLTAADGTSGVASISYRIDNAAWQTYTAPFVVATDGTHTIEYYASDVAGNDETAWNVPLRIDTVAPATTSSLSGTAGTGGWYRSDVVATLSAADASSGIASTSYRIDGGSWQTYSGPFFVSGDGMHTLDYYSTDRAGNAAAAVSIAVNVDATAPGVTTASPRGANVNATPVITVVFSEPMDRTSVETAFSINPDMNGAFSWSADSRTLTFLPDRSLDPSTTYVVFIDSRARDAAGNPLSGAYSFSFTTATAPLGFGFADAWWLLALIAALGGGTLFMIMRKRMAAASKPTPPAAAAKKPAGEATIDDVFLLYRDGLLIKHETRRLKPDIDTDILSGMLTAVQQFVKDSFRSEEGELDELTFGQMHILIGRGKWTILAAMIQGDGTDEMMEQVKRCVQDIEDHQWDQLDDWDGDMELAKVLGPYVKKLVRGEYA